MIDEYFTDWLYKDGMSDRNVIDMSWNGEIDECNSDYSFI